MEKKKVIISGINGYLARNLANELTSLNNFEVIGFGRSSEKHKLLKGEITIISFEEIDSYAQNFDVDIIIHAATNYGRSNETIESMLSSNLILPIKLYSIARRHKVPYFINIDTILPKNYSEYALSKKQFREWAKHLHFSNKFFVDDDCKKSFKVINLEFEHFYGPGAPSSNFVTWITEQLLENRKNIELTECTQERDFLFITDAVSAIKTIVLNLERLESFESITIGSGSPIPLKVLLVKAKKIYNSKSTFNFGAIPIKQNQMNLQLHSHNRIKELGWKAKISIEEGLHQMKKSNDNDKKI